MGQHGHRRPRGTDAGSAVLSPRERTQAPRVDSTAEAGGAEPGRGDCELDHIARGVPADRAREVAELFYLSFGEKLAGLVLPREREAGVELLASAFCLDEVYGAFDASGRVLGVAFVTGHDRVVCLSREALDAAYGRVGAAWRWAAYRALTGRRRAHPRDTRGLEGFSVAADCRGKGIGAAMIERIASDARAEGARAIELNVGDTNPARHLYERAGFKVTRTGGVGPFSRRLGFKRFVYYELEL